MSPACVGGMGSVHLQAETPTGGCAHACPLGNWGVHSCTCALQCSGEGAGCSGAGAAAQHFHQGSRGARSCGAPLGAPQMPGQHNQRRSQGHMSPLHALYPCEKQAPSTQPSKHLTGQFCRACPGLPQACSWLPDAAQRSFCQCTTPVPMAPQHPVLGLLTGQVILKCRAWHGACAAGPSQRAAESARPPGWLGASEGCRPAGGGA